MGDDVISTGDGVAWDHIIDFDAGDGDVIEISRFDIADHNAFLSVSHDTEDGAYVSLKARLTVSSSKVSRSRTFRPMTSCSLETLTADITVRRTSKGW